MILCSKILLQKLDIRDITSKFELENETFHIDEIIAHSVLKARVINLFKFPEY